MDDARLGRIEGKVDDLTSAMTKLVRVEERQLHAQGQINAADKKAQEALDLAHKADRKVDTWVNRGLGLWGAAMAIWAVLTSPIGEKFFGI